MAAVMPIAFVQFKNCRVYIWNANYLETVFPDGLKVPAEFVVNHETLRTARENGYGANVRAMHLDHELLHTFLSEVLGRPHSLVLRAAAERLQSGEEWAFDQVRSDEEGIVLAFQKYLRTGEITPFLEQIPRFAWQAQEYSSRFQKLIDDVRDN